MTDFPDLMIRPQDGADPFFREIDRALAVQRARDAERRIRARANRILQTILFDPWQIGGPDAQTVEMHSAHRVIRESFAREGVTP